MGIKINYIVIHELIKEPTQSEIQVRLEFSDTALEINEQSDRLIETLNNRYNSSRHIITHGVFEQQNNQGFPVIYNSYHQEYSLEAFLEMTRLTLTDLKNQIQNINFAKGGYFIYADYNIDKSGYFGVFLIRNTNGMLFEKDISSNSYKINSTIQVDLEKIAMGCRINKTSFRDKNGKYLSFTKNNNKEDISKYFINWLCATELNNNRICTQELLKLVNKIPLPKDDQGVEISREVFKQKIFDFAHSSPNSNLNLANLSEMFYDDPDYLLKYDQENYFTIDNEFKPDGRVLKSFIQVSIKEDNVSVFIYSRR